MGATGETTREAKGGKRRQKTMLAAAVSHPLRTRVFAILGERTASPVEISRELHEDVSNVNYHVGGLVAWGLVQEVDSRPVRGSVEHFFRAVEIPGLTAEEEKALWPEERRTYAETILSLFTRDAVRSLDEKLLYLRTDHYLCRTAFETDERGWAEAVEAYEVCFTKVAEVKEAAAERVTQKKAEDEKFQPLRMLSFLAAFELPPMRPQNVPPPALPPIKP